MDYTFYILGKYIQFRRKQKPLLRKLFSLKWPPHTSNRIYLLWNCFANYIYLKDVYITMKGIGKIRFVSVLRIFLICKFLNFTAVFIIISKFILNSKFSKVCIQFSVSGSLYTMFGVRKFVYNFRYQKVYLSLIHPTHTIHGFWKTQLLSS